MDSEESTTTILNNLINVSNSNISFDNTNVYNKEAIQSCTQYLQNLLKKHIIAPNAVKLTKELKEDEQPQLIIEDAFSINPANIILLNGCFNNEHVFTNTNDAKNVILQLSQDHKNYLLYNGYAMSDEYYKQIDMLEWIINSVNILNDKNINNYDYRQFYKEFLKKMGYILHQSIDFIKNKILLSDLPTPSLTTMFNNIILMHTQQQLNIESKLNNNEYDISYCCQMLFYWYAMNFLCNKHIDYFLQNNENGQYNYNPTTTKLNINNTVIDISNHETGSTKKTLNAKLANFLNLEEAEQCSSDELVNIARNIIIFLNLPGNDNCEIKVFDKNTKKIVTKTIVDLFEQFSNKLSKYCTNEKGYQIESTFQIEQALIINYALLCMHNQIYLSSPYNDINNEQNIIKNNNEPAPISSNNGPNLQFDDNNQPQEVILENFIKNNNSNIKNNDKNNDTEQEENKNNNIDQQQNNEKNNNTPEYSTPNNDNLKEEVNKPNTVNDNQLLSDQQKKIMLIAGIIVPIIGAVIVFIIVIIVKHTIKQNDKNTIKYFNKNNNFKDIKNHNEYFLNEHYNDNNLRHL